MSIQSPYLFPLVGAAFITLVAAAISSLEFGFPWLWAVLIGLNFAVFCLCGFDKLRAREGGFRVPEGALVTLALLGGTLGLLLGMKLFRHKTKKASFQIMLLVVLLVQLMFLKGLDLGAYLTP